MKLNRIAQKLIKYNFAQQKMIWDHAPGKSGAVFYLLFRAATIAEKFFTSSYICGVISLPPSNTAN